MFSFAYVVQRNQRPPTPDPLFGFRTHAWVMIMKGKRSVENSFFLEPFSGLRKEISDPNFLGIEAVFNEKNYYANIQDCSAGISVGFLIIKAVNHLLYVRFSDFNYNRISVTT